MFVGRRREDQREVERGSKKERERRKEGRKVDGSKGKEDEMERLIIPRYFLPFFPELF